MENILEIDSLTKNFATRKALDNVSFNVTSGSVFGLLGPNGAGKTTLLRIINSILVADSGEVRILGEKASLENTSRYLGYMPEERGLYDKMRVDQQIMYFGLLRGGDPGRLRNVMNDYLELFNLTSDRKRRVKELSKGNQQKVQIIATLVHEPPLVILDEPFSGFDPINGAILRELIERLRSAGSTVILSSHNMSAIEDMCDSMALIDHGHLLLDGRIDDIKERHKDRKLLLTTRRPISEAMLADSGLTISINPASTKRKGAAYEIEKRGGVSNGDLLAAISMQAEIIHFEEKLPSLNDLFIAYTLPLAKPDNTTITNE